jgi:hypothetical protein
MRRCVLLGLAVIVLCGSLRAAQTGQGPQAPLGAQSSGDDIMREADRVSRGFVGERSVFTLVMINAQGDRTERRFTLELRENEQDAQQSRIDFDWPENVRGTVLLTHAHKAAEDDLWLFLPAAGRVRRISAGSRSGSFMGSEFTYEDLTPFVLSKYSYNRMADDTVDGKPCFLVERRPRTEGSGYSRQLVWLDKQHVAPVKMEYYDRKNDLLKVAYYREDRTVGGYQRYDLVRMENRQTKRVSELRAGNRQLGLALDASRFRSQALDR